MATEGEKNKDRTIPVKSETGRWGKGASDLSPEEQKIDPKIGFILAASLPMALIVFWKVTIPLAYFIVSTVMGAELMQKISFLRQDILNLMLSECHPWISAEERAFLDDQSYHQIKRFQVLTKEKFKELVSSGEPFIITDAMTNWTSYMKWDCPTFFQTYPDVKFLDWQSQKELTFRDITTTPGHDDVSCVSGYLDDSTEAKKKYFQEWLQHLPLPYFMKIDSVMVDSSESYRLGSIFIGMPGTGVAPHVVESCSNFMSAQITGVTSWSFSWPVFEDGNIRWSKPIRFYLQPGEMIFWFSSMRHHVEVAEGCSLTFNFKFNSPVPKNFYEKVKQDVSSLLAEMEDGSGDNRVTSDLSFIKDCSFHEEEGQWKISYEKT